MFDKQARSSDSEMLLGRPGGFYMRGNAVVGRGLEGFVIFNLMIWK